MKDTRAGLRMILNCFTIPLVGQIVTSRPSAAWLLERLRPSSCQRSLARSPLWPRESREDLPRVCGLRPRTLLNWEAPWGLMPRPHISDPTSPSTRAPTAGRQSSTVRVHRKQSRQRLGVNTGSAPRGAARSPQNDLLACPAGRRRDASTADAGGAAATATGGEHRRAHCPPSSALRNLPPPWSSTRTEKSRGDAPWRWPCRCPTKLSLDNSAACPHRSSADAERHPQRKELRFSGLNVRSAIRTDVSSPQKIRQDGPRRRDTKKLCLTITSERIEGRGRCLHDRQRAEGAGQRNRSRRRPAGRRLVRPYKGWAIIPGLLMENAAGCRMLVSVSYFSEVLKQPSLRAAIRASGIRRTNIQDVSRYASASSRRRSPLHSSGSQQPGSLPSVRRDFPIGRRSQCWFPPGSRP